MMSLELSLGTAFFCVASFIDSLSLHKGKRAAINFKLISPFSTSSTERKHVSFSVVSIKSELSLIGSDCFDLGHLPCPEPITVPGEL